MLKQHLTVAFGWGVARFNKSQTKASKPQKLNHIWYAETGIIIKKTAKYKKNRNTCEKYKKHFHFKESKDKMVGNHRFRAKTYTEMLI